jgi:hypothetical protein
MSAPPGLSGRLSVLAAQVVEKNQWPQPSNPTFADYGESGIMFYDGVPYYISIMPVMPGMTSGGAVGTVILGIIVDNEYFCSLSKFDGAVFEWEQTGADLQRESGYVTRKNGTFAVANMPMTDIYGAPAQLIMSGPRRLYAQGRQQIYFASIFMFGAALILGALLYLIITRMILWPMKKLNTGIAGIAISGSKLDLAEMSRIYDDPSGI